MTTYTDLFNRVIRLLDDPSNKQFSEEIIYYGICAAHDEILPWVPKFATVSCTSGSDSYTLTLPSDCYQVDTVQVVDTGLFLGRATLSPGTVRNYESLYADNDWIEYPSGTLTLAIPQDEGTGFLVYYRAYWRKPTSESDANFVIEVPSCAHNGMVLYAASHCLLSKARVTSNIAQWKTRVDSGNPEDNPWDLLSDVFLKRFYQAMKIMPSYVRVPQ